MITLIVAVAGGVGAGLRAWIDALAAPRGEQPAPYPWGTIAVNLTGSALIGVIAGLGVGVLSPAWASAVGAGFLGGYTTFSTAAVQTAQMLLARRWARAALYGLGLLLGAGILAAAGLWAGHLAGAALMR